MQYIFLFFFILITSCSVDQNSERNISLADYSEVLHHTTKFNFSENGDILLTPFKTVNINDDYLIISELRNDDFFNVFGIKNMNYLYSWGEISRGPNPEEFPARPIDIFSMNGNLVVYEPVSKKLKHISVKDTSLTTIREESLGYRNQLDPLNRINAFNDSTYIADYGLSHEDTNHEYVILKPDKSEIITTFGEYPDSDLESVERYEHFLKSNVISKEKELMAAFYFYHNKFKLFDKNGNLISSVNIADSIHSEPDGIDNYIYRNASQATENYIYSLGYYTKRDNVFDSTDDQVFRTTFEVWDWNGNSIYRSYFDHQITMFTVSEKFNKIYALSNLETAVIFEYDLPDF